MVFGTSTCRGSKTKKRDDNNDGGCCRFRRDAGLRAAMSGRRHTYVSAGERRTQPCSNHRVGTMMIIIERRERGGLVPGTDIRKTVFLLVLHTPQDELNTFIFVS